MFSVPSLLTATFCRVNVLKSNQFTAMPFDSLKSRAGTITVTKPPLPYTRKVMVDSLSPRLRRVTVVVTPLNTLFRPDTVVLQRTKPGNNPFNKP